MSTETRTTPDVDDVSYEDRCILFSKDEHLYDERVARGVFGMFTHTANRAVAAAVARVRAQINHGTDALTARAALRAEIMQLHASFSEVRDSEVGIHLAHAFADIIPEGDDIWPRGWLLYEA